MKVTWGEPEVNHPPFLICGTPRSRTAWLARFLSYGRTACAHEQVLRAETLGQYVLYFGGRNVGDSDSPATFLADIVKAAYPQLRIIIVRRDRAEVIASARRRGLMLEHWFMDALEAKISRLIYELAPMVIDYPFLERQDTCAEIFETCLGLPFDRQWWKRWDRQPVEANLRASLRLIKANDGLRSFLLPLYRSAGENRRAP